MSAGALSSRRLRTGDLEIDLDRGEVRLAGREVPLRSQSLQVLLYLIEHRDRLVGKDELHTHIWGSVSVGDDALVQCVADIRRVLGDDARAPRFVRTVPKRGYRFVADLEGDSGVGLPSSPQPSLAEGRRRASGSGAVTALLLLVAVVALAVSTSSTDPAGAALTRDLEAYRHYIEGLEHSRALRPVEAIAAFERAIARDPEFAMAHARIGYVYAVRHAQLDRAKPHLSAALARSERLDDRERLRVTAWLAIANQAYDQAIAASRALFDRDSNDVEVAVQLITLLQGEGRLEEALEVATLAAAAAPRDPAVHNVLGSTHSLLGQHDAAVKAQLRQVRLVPSSANALDSLGLAYQWAGRYSEAIESYERAIELDAGFEVAWFHMGNTLAQLGRYRDARAAFERAIAVSDYDADRARGHVLVGLVALTRASWAEADAALDRATTLAGRVPPEAALVAIARGDRSGAIALIDQSLVRAATRGAGVTRRFGGVLRAWAAELEGRPDDQIAHLTAALRHPPPTFAFDTFEDALGQAYLRLGRVREAVGEFERVLAVNPRYPAARFGLAQALERLGDASRARHAYLAFLDVWRGADPDAPLLIEAQQRLARLAPVANGK